MGEEKGSEAEKERGLIRLEKKNRSNGTPDGQGGYKEQADGRDYGEDTPLHLAGWEGKKH